MSGLDEVPMPDVKHLCRRCVKIGGGSLTHYKVASGYVVVSPTGTAHESGEYEFTSCGIDATGLKWWWPL